MCADGSHSSWETRPGNRDARAAAVPGVRAFRTTFPAAVKLVREVGMAFPAAVKPVRGTGTPSRRLAKASGVSGRAIFPP